MIEEVEIPDRPNEVSVAYITALTKDLRAAQRDAHESRDKFDKVKDENEHLFNQYRNMLNTISNNEAVIQELNDSIELARRQSETILQTQLRSIRSIAITLVARINNRDRAKRENVIGKFVTLHWRRFVFQRKHDRMKKLLDTVVTVISTRFGNFLSIIRTFTPPKREREIVKEIVVLSGPACMSLGVQIDRKPPIFSLSILDSISIQKEDKSVDASTEMSSPVLHIQSVPHICVDPLHNCSMNISSFLAAEIASNSPLQPASSEHRERRQRVLIRLLNKRVSRLEFRLRRRKSRHSS